MCGIKVRHTFRYQSWVKLSRGPAHWPTLECLHSWALGSAHSSKAGKQRVCSLLWCRELPRSHTDSKLLSFHLSLSWFWFGATPHCRRHSWQGLGTWGTRPGAALLTDPLKDKFGTRTSLVVAVVWKPCVLSGRSWRWHAAGGGLSLHLPARGLLP